jgi:hypothetical protein
MRCDDPLGRFWTRPAVSSQPGDAIPQESSGSDRTMNRSNPYREGRTPTGVTLYVRQCRSTNPPSTCGTIAATHDEATGLLNLSIGHVYQACSSVQFPDGWKTVNQCSPFIAYP